MTDKVKKQVSFSNDHTEESAREAAKLLAEMSPRAAETIGEAAAHLVIGMFEQEEPHVVLAAAQIVMAEYATFVAEKPTMAQFKTFFDQSAEAGRIHYHKDIEARAAMMDAQTMEPGESMDIVLELPKGETHPLFLTEGSKLKN